MSETQPKVTEQISMLIDIARKNLAETQKLSTALGKTNFPREEKYKYQSSIDFLKEQGKADGQPSSSTIPDRKCLEPQEALDILKDLVDKSEKRKCLTKEELVSFFQPKRTPSRITEPPISK